MKTRGEAIAEDAEHTLHKLTVLTHQSFSRADLSALIEPFTSRLEYYLKSVAFPTISRRTSLNDLIDNLSSLGLAAPQVTSLHTLRQLYNKSKHDPDVDLKSQECIRSFEAAVVALRAITTLGITSIDAPQEPSFNTVVYVGLWDHYVGGETEVGLFLPSNHWMGTTPISTFHLHWSSWDHLKPALADHPRYSRGEEALGSTLWKSFSDEGDFLDAGVWEGDVRELLELLSAHNDESLEEAVIPFLARRNNLISVGIALVSATVDTVRAIPTANEVDLRECICERAKTEYAAEVQTPHGHKILDSVIHCVESVPHNERVAISGPAFRIYSEEEDGELDVPIKLLGTTLTWLVS
ncbi:hypothetical protein HGG70_06430 [Rhodobacteraceae bacterium R_SAG4]|nr:hypothetical protein [Rhodobacteraceae bacterium R_SAG4]